MSAKPELKKQQEEKINLGKIIPRILIGLIIYGALLFLPAGTIYYLPGWMFIGTITLCYLFIMPFMYFKHPDALKRRLKQREKEKEQRVIIAIMALAAFSGIVLCGLDYRWGWSQMPIYIVALGNVLMGLSMLGITWVNVVNEFAGRTIEVVDKQTVISIGPYAWVRHPMYGFYLLLLTALPIALGSYWAFPLFVLIFPIIFHFRMINEEKLLARELEGYSEYCRKVRSRIVPFIW